VHVVKGVDGSYTVDLQAEPVRPMVLHWALSEWIAPPENIWPPNTRREGDKACQTPFGGDGRIRMHFPQAICPQGIVFVLKELAPEAWINDGGTDFQVHLRPPGIETVASKVLAAEGTYSHWSLFQRFCLAIELLDAADAAGPEGMALIYTWLRLSTQRVLDWYRLSNYQSKDIAHVQKTLAQRMADKARSAKTPTARQLARMALEGLPRGGGNGDDIRMGILNIMRANGIKEGHRPGIDEQFLEQWHQKLHTNTTPDDIAICEAYLAYLHSGNHDDYWRVLWDSGKLTKESLESFSKPIRAWPMHLPHLINPFKHYLWLLKVTHSGADLDTAAEMCKGIVDDDLRWNIFDVLGHREEWWVPGKIVEVRERLKNYWTQPDASRDLLLLDCALENWFRLRLERTDRSQLKGDDLIELLALVLRSTLISVEDGELSQVAEQWEWVRSNAPGARWSKEWALAALATAQRTELSVAAHMDRIYGLVQPHAEAFQAACKLDAKHILNFGEEVVRGQPLFLSAQLLQALEPSLRAAAGVSSWQVISQGASSPTGKVLAIGSLAEVQGLHYASPTILVADHVGGDEDIPAGVVAVLTRSATDVLSHAAIRARAQRVLLATCFDESQWGPLKELAGAPSATVTVTLEGDVRGTPGTSAVGDVPAEGGDGKGAHGIVLAQPKVTDKWALQETEFQAGLVGAKALNCAALAAAPGKPDWLRTPGSVSLPWGAAERAMAHPANANVLGAVMSGQTHIAKLSAKGTADLTPALQELATIRQAVATQLVAPPELVAEVSAAAAAAGLIPSASAWAEGTPGWSAAWDAIRRVWASKWNDRAWLGRRQAGVQGEVFMGVLLQQVVPADYAYVLHTAHPVTHTPGVLYGEVVAGMGEALVGNYPGRALSFSAPLDGSGGATLHSLPAKRVALRAPAPAPGAPPLIIARSDANGEDLAGLAGAGLYDSVPLAPLTEEPVNYARLPLVNDPGMRGQLLGQLVEVGRVVRAAFGGGEQDVEGVVANGQVWVVQSRPQVLH